MPNRHTYTPGIAALYNALHEDLAEAADEMYYTARCGNIADHMAAGRVYHGIADLLLRLTGTDPRPNA